MYSVVAPLARNLKVAVRGRTSFWIRNYRIVLTGKYFIPLSNWAKISNRTYIWNYIVRCLRLPSAPLFLSCLSIQFCRRTELNLAAALSPSLPLFLVDSKRRRHWTESGFCADQLRRLYFALPQLFQPGPGCRVPGQQRRSGHLPGGGVHGLGGRDVRAQGLSAWTDDVRPEPQRFRVRLRMLFLDSFAATALANDRRQRSLIIAGLSPRSCVGTTARRRRRTSCATWRSCTSPRTTTPTTW